MTYEIPDRQGCEIMTPGKRLAHEYRHELAGGLEERMAAEIDAFISAERDSAIGKLANWMIENGFATGHGESLDDLLKELTWQIEELRERLRNNTDNRATKTGSRKNAR